MSNRALATLAVRLMGIYAWFQVVSTVPMIPYLFTFDFMREEAKGAWLAMVIMAFVALAVWIGLGFVLILASDRIARRIAPADEEPRPQPSAPSSLQAVLFSVVGLVLVVHSIPGLVRYLIEIVASARWEGAGPPWIPIAVLGLEFLMGVALFLGSRGLSRIWRRIGEMNRMP